MKSAYHHPLFATRLRNRLSPTPYEVARLSVAMNDTTDKGVADAMHLLHRAAATVEAYKEAAAKEAAKRSNSEVVPFSEVLDSKSPDFIAAKPNTILKYMIEARRRTWRVVDGIVPGDPAKNAELDLEHYKAAGLTVREIETLKAIKLEANAERGRKNRTPKKRKPRK